MHNFSKSLLTLALIGGAALAMPLVSNAQVLQLKVSDNLGHTVTVQDMGAGDANASLNAITINNSTGFLSSIFPELTGLSSLSLSLTNAPNLVILGGNGMLFSNANAIFTIVASAWNLSNPNAPFFRAETGSATFNFASVPAGVSGSSTNGVSTVNNTVGVNNLNNPTFNYASTGTAANGDGSPMSGFAFNNGNTQYSINSLTTLGVDIGGGDSQYGTLVNITAGVPEPGNIALVLGAGLSGSLFALRMRRRRK